MSKKPKKGSKPPQTRGFWDRHEPKAETPKPEVLSVRHSSSRLARCVNFLRRIAGLPPKKD